MTYAVVTLQAVAVSRFVVSVTNAYFICIVLDSSTPYARPFDSFGAVSFLRNQLANISVVQVDLRTLVVCM